MLQKILLILLLCDISQLAIAQSEGDIKTPKIIPPSPDAAALGKYGQIPVDKSTGIPQISIPLYEIKTPRFNLPILLSYHASGIKVDEISSWVGAGWSLNAGGAITRSIIGLPDDKDYTGYINNTVKRANDIQWLEDRYYIADVLNKRLDTDPDNFFYNFNHHSGSFVFGFDKKPVLIPYEPTKIEFDNSSKSFTITDEQGNTYFFNTKEYVSSSIPGSSGVSSWYLTQMISADKTDTITFNYSTDGTLQTQSLYTFSQKIAQDVSYGSFGPFLLRPLEKTANFNQFYTVRLSSIVFNGGKIDFVTQPGRLDDGIMSLDAINISSLDISTNQYQQIKSFKLLTDYFYNPDPGPSNYFISITEANKHRLKLTAVQENDMTNTAIKTYQFEYNPTLLPFLHSSAQDNWGYYNGKNSNLTLLEPRTILIDQSSSTQTVAVVGTNGTVNEGGDRSVSPGDAQAGILTKIIYPTKGYTKFAYESNQQIGTTYTHVNFNTSAIGAQNTGGSHEIVTNSYTPTPDVLNSGGKIFMVKLSSGTNSSSSSSPFVKVVRASDGLVIYNSAANGTANTTINNLILPLEPGVEYTITAEAHGMAVNGYPSSSSPYAIISTSYDLPSSSLVNVGGLRIKSIKNFNSDDTQVGNETYFYGNNDESGAGTQLSFLPTNVYKRGCYYSNGAVGSLPSSYLITYTSNTVYPMATLNGSPVAYPTVTLYHGDPLLNSGKSVYKYEVYPDSIFVAWGGSGYGTLLKPTSVMWKNGDPKWEGHYRNDGTNNYSLINETTYTYNTLGRQGGIGSTIGYNGEPQDFVFDNPTLVLYNDNGVVINVISAGGQLWRSSSRFYWSDYPISTGVRLLAQTVTKNHLGSNLATLTETTNYTYNNLDHLQPTIITTINSKGESNRKELKYPSDFSALEPYATMMSRNIVTPVIEQLQFKGSSVDPLISIKTNYNFWNGATRSTNPTNIIVPETVEMKKLGQLNYEPKIRYHTYDSKANILTFSKENNINNTYLWGYNKKYPVAEIVGADYTTVRPFVDQTILDTPPSDAAFQTELYNLRNGLISSKALVTTYTYKPLIGISTQTDPNGKTTYYEYDSFNRLQAIKDKNGNVVKTFDYQYQKLPNQ